MAGVYDSVSKKLIIPGEQDIEYYYGELTNDGEKYIVKGRDAKGIRTVKFDMEGNPL